MPDKATIYGVCLAAIVIGIIVMSVSSAELDKIKDAKKKSESPIIAGVVIGVVLIVAGVGVAGYQFFQKSDATAMVGTAPGGAAGSATVANVPPQNPVTAIENAARAKKNAAEHAVNNASQIEKAAKELNAVMKASET